jgi:hypothetical protein
MSAMAPCPWHKQIELGKTGHSLNDYCKRRCASLSKENSSNIKHTQVVAIKCKGEHALGPSLPVGRQDQHRKVGSIPRLV